MSTIEARFQGLMELGRTWADRVANTEADKKVIDELLQATEDREKKYKEEIS